MADVRLDGGDERVLVRADEELDADLALAVLDGGAQTMHAVEHGHRLAVHENRRKVRVHPREDPDVIGFLALQPGTVSEFQKLNGNC
ncbi:hypothetical protein GCM10022254_27330 [Actinomadura meridiana]|uniref:Uncharacterized protein n=1 Tax=Actinomadura meridiana TaxID=559626 RepID=A0ABP8BZK4_9ACTN